MSAPDVELRDSRPPEYDESQVEDDLQAAADAGGLTDIGDERDDIERAAPPRDDEREHELLARTRAWLDEHPDAVRS